MSSLTKLAAYLAVLLVMPAIAHAFTPCKGNLSGIEVIEGSYDPPGYQPPDSESYRPTGKWPDNLIEQGWHNLRKAKRPLSILCRYGSGQKEKVVLPEGTNDCVLRNGRSGLFVTCK